MKTLVLALLIGFSFGCAASPEERRVADGSSGNSGSDEADNGCSQGHGNGHDHHGNGQGNGHDHHHDCDDACVSASQVFHPISTVCDAPSGQLCNPTLQTSFEAASSMTLAFVANSGHCSDIRVHLSVDGAVVFSSAPLGPGVTTGPVEIPLLSAGSHLIGVQAEGVVSGCNTGTLYSWAGTLELATEGDCNGE